MTVSYLLRILWLRRAIVLTVLAASLATGIGMGLTLPKSYMGRARIMIDLAVDPTTGVKLDPRIFPFVVWTQSNLMKDPTVVINAAKRLGYLPQRDPDPRDTQSVALRNRVIRQLDRTVYVDVVPDTNILDITAFGSSPAEARRVADAFRVAYIDLSVNLQRSSAIGALKIMRERLLTLLHDRDEAAAQRAAFERAHHVVLQEDGKDDSAEQLKQIAKGNDELLARMGRRTAMAPANAAGLARLDAQIAMAQTQMGPNNPTVQALVSQRAAIEAAAAPATQQVAAPQQANVASMMSVQVEKILAERGVLAEGQMLVTRQYALDGVMRGLAGRIVATAQQASVMNGGVRPVGAATEQIDAVSPNLPLVIAVAGVIGLIVGCQLAIVVELLNRRVRNQQDLAGFEPAVLVVIGADQPVESEATVLARAA